MRTSALGRPLSTVGKGEYVGFAVYRAYVIFAGILYCGYSLTFGRNPFRLFHDEGPKDVEWIWPGAEPSIRILNLLKRAGITGLRNDKEEVELTSVIKEIKEGLKTRPLNPDEMNFVITRGISTMTLSRLTLPEVSLGHNVGFIHNAEPSWVVDGDHLNRMEFYRAVPHLEAWQSLSQWISGVLPSAGRETIELSDTMKAAKHGMDKTSFRKPPQKKRV